MAENSNGKKEYLSKRKLVNDLIRQARKQQDEINWVRAKLGKGEIVVLILKVKMNL